MVLGENAVGGYHPFLVATDKLGQTAIQLLGYSFMIKIYACISRHRFKRKAPRCTKDVRRTIRGRIVWNKLRSLDVLVAHVLCCFALAFTQLPVGNREGTMYNVRHRR